MSGIAAVVRLDGGSVTPPELSALVDALEVWGGDGRDAWLDGCVGLGAQRFVVTPEDALDHQPVWSPGRDAVGVVDGRLDNRSTLASAVGWQQPLRVTTDSALVLAAYERWGESCLHRLAGEFAFIIWDLRRRRLLAAKDQMGLRPLVYAHVGPYLLLASDQATLVRHPLVPDDIDEATVAEHLALEHSTPEATLYRAVRRLPPASSLLARDGVAVRRWWSPSQDVDNPPRTDEDYVEEYRAFLTGAVRERMRTTGICVSTLSGGIDSSSITALAVGLSRTEPGLPPVEGFAQRFVGSLRGDETRWIDAVQRSVDVPVRTHIPVPRPPERLAAEASAYLDTPDHPTEPLEVSSGRDPDRRTVLSGVGGDWWFWPWSEYLAELAKGLHLIRFAQYLRLQNSSTFALGLRPLLTKSTLRPLLEPRLPGLFASRDRRHRRQGGIGFVHPDLARAVDLESRLQRPPLDLRPAARARWWALGFAGIGWTNDRQARMAAHRGFVLRLPFLAPPFIEWALRLPEHLRWRDDQRRWIQRQAMAGVLPDEVRLRPTKGELSSIIRADLAVNVDQFADLEVVGRGWVDGRAVDAALTTLLRAPELTDEGPAGNPLHNLWAVLAVETWLRHGRPSVSSQTHRALHPVIPPVPRSETR